MSRLATPPTVAAVPPASRSMLEAVNKQLGVAPKVARLDDAEMTANRAGVSNDPKASVAVEFAAKVLRDGLSMSRAPVVRTPRTYPSDVAFTESVKGQQQRKGSRAAYARMEEGGSWQTQVTPSLREFIARQRSVLLATASLDGQPYIQHRGGPPGFLRVLDERTLGFADFAGNRQYITLGNLAENPQAYLFLIDYELRRRIKIWGEARAVEGDAELLAQLSPHGYRARPERVILFTLAAWDSNCPQHIPRRYEAADVEGWLAEKDARIAALEAEVVQLRAARPPST